MPTGWSPGSRAIGEMAQLYPHSTAARVYFRPGEGLPASAWTDPTRVGRQALVDLPAGCTVIVSFKDQGVDRLAFVEAWQKYRPDVALDLITHHEPEQQDGGDPTPVQYRASWTRTREQVGDHPARAAGRLRLATCWTLQWIRRGGDWRIWWPDHEAHAVDLLYFDWYPYVGSEPDPWKPRFYEDPVSALAVPAGIAAQLGKPWGLAEVDHPRILKVNGFSVDLDPDGALCAPWYRAMHAAAKAAGCRAWAHFHANSGAAVGDLTARPAEQQALRDLIEQEAPGLLVSGIRFVEGRNEYTDRDGTKYGIAIHNTSNTASAADEASYATRRTDGTSSHFYCDGAEVIQSIDTKYRAGHAGSYEGNEHAVAVEITGTNDKSRAWWIANVCWDKLGQVLAQVCRKYGIEPRRASVDEMKANPKVRAFYSHDDMRRAWGGTTHTDPGGNFPWDHLFAAVKASLDGTATLEDPLSALTDAEQRELLALARSTRTSVNVTAYRVAALISGALTYNNQMGDTAARNVLAEQLKALADKLNAPQPDPVDEQALAAAITQQVTAAVLAALPAGNGPVSREDLEAALRKVLGSVDEQG